MQIADLHGVGVRLRYLRKLHGMTQDQLAARAHFSTSLVKKVEQGSVPPSAAFVAGAARALGVGVPYLYGSSEETPGEPAADRALISALRIALDSYDDPQPESEPMDLTTITALLGAAGRDLDRQRYEIAARDLPELLHQLYVLADSTGHAAEEARAALHDAYRIAASVAGKHRQSDLAAVASDRHIQLAPLTGDPLRIGRIGVPPRRPPRQPRRLRGRPAHTRPVQAVRRQHPRRPGHDNPTGPTRWRAQRSSRQLTDRR